MTQTSILKIVMAWNAKKSFESQIVSVQFSNYHQKICKWIRIYYLLINIQVRNMIQIRVYWKVCRNLNQLNKLLTTYKKSMMNLKSKLLSKLKFSQEIINLFLIRTMIRSQILYNYTINMNSNYGVIGIGMTCANQCLIWF